jgi:hypothetical protein
MGLQSKTEICLQALGEFGGFGDLFRYQGEEANCERYLGGSCCQIGRLEEEMTEARSIESGIDASIQRAIRETANLPKYKNSGLEN